MLTDCGGSWEESPPSLIDVAIRDRRWAQGNLQHMKIIGTAGLSFTSRLHLGIGIMSYLSSPLWLVMLLIGFALSVQSHLIRPEYFNHDFQLFPTWPRFDVETDDGAVLVQHVRAADSEDAGLIRALLSKRIRRGSGGVIGVAPASRWKPCCRRCTRPFSCWCRAGMCSRCSWAATPAGSRSAATAAAPRGATPGTFTSATCSSAA
jgi:hypothetical protein